MGSRRPVRAEQGGPAAASRKHVDRVSLPWIKRPSPKVPAELVVTKEKPIRMWFIPQMENYMELNANEMQERVTVLTNLKRRLDFLKSKA